MIASVLTTKIARVGRNPINDTIPGKFSHDDCTAGWTAKHRVMRVPADVRTVVQRRIALDRKCLPVPAAVDYGRGAHIAVSGLLFGEDRKTAF